MRSRTRDDEDGSLTVRQLSVLFLALVAVCAVFFSLGFIVGHRQQAPAGAPVSQKVSTATGDVPPPVNAPLEDEPIPTSANAPSPNQSAEPSVGTGGSAAKLGANPATPSASLGAETPESTRLDLPKPPSTRVRGASAESAEEAPPGISLQVAASHVRQDAESMVRMLQGRGYAAYLMTPQRARASDGLYRVEVGPFRSRREADRARKRLGQEGFKSFVRK